MNLEAKEGLNENLKKFNGKYLIKHKMKTSFEEKVQIIDSIKNKVESSTLFQLLWYIEQLSDTLVAYKDKSRSIKDKKSLIEANITIEINLNDSIKATNKKAEIEVAKSKHKEYLKLNTEYNNLDYLIESIEKLIKIITLKYKLVEPAFHINGVLTYKQLESEYRTK